MKPNETDTSDLVAAGWLIWPLPNINPTVDVFPVRAWVDGKLWVWPKPISEAEAEWDNITFEYMGEFENPPTYPEMLAWIVRMGYEKYAHKIADFTAAWVQMDSNNDEGV